MTWAEPKYSRGEVDAAGAALLTVNDAVLDDTWSFEDYDHALTVINNWRSSHAFPLNTFQMTLRNKAKQVSPRVLVAQRVKRLTSISDKLDRLKWLKLSEMQDIAGCRAVLRSVRAVDNLAELYMDSYIKHELADHDDYIRNPKASGYRGIHLIYRYYSDKKETYNGLKIEMQFRSTLQHAWATAVETVGTFTRQSLKSSRGEKDWLRFFALMGTWMALRERTTPVPRTPSDPVELVRELREYAGKLDVQTRLNAYGAALQTLERSVTQNTHYFLLVLDPVAQSVIVTGYRFTELDRASTEYLAAERAIAEAPGSDAVLVSVESIAALKRAYPNYFLDTRLFVREVSRAISDTPHLPRLMRS